MEVTSNIRAISECYIKPKYVVDESKKPFFLGTFELAQMSRSYIQTGFMFGKPPPEVDGGMVSFVEKLKHSLSSTLAHFYPLAGQLVTNVDDEEHNSFIFIDCNKGRGAKFIHASYKDVTIDDIVSPSYVPMTLNQSFFELGRVPRNYDAHDEPMLGVQVTELADGVFLGVSVNHAVVDGTTFWHFMLSWSEIFQSNDTMISRLPIYKRWFPEGFGPIIKIPCTHPGEFLMSYKKANDSPTKEAIFHISCEAVENIKAKANAECNKISSFQALAALLWRCITRSRRPQGDETSECLVVADARSRLRPPLSRDYFGSFICPIGKSMKVGELLAHNLGSIALSLHGAIEAFTDESVRHEFIKWAKSPSFYRAGLDQNFVLIGGLPREDMYSVDFGLGRAVSIRSGSSRSNGRVILRPTREGKGSVSAEICLSQEDMNRLQQDEEFASFLS